MGGSGCGRSIGSDELDKLTKVARDSLREASGAGKRNVFISFASEDLNEVNLLRGQAKNENSEIEFNDWSLKRPFDSKDAEYIRRGIRERIRQSSVTIVYISEHTAQSQWVDWEIRESHALGKKVIGMYQCDSPPKTLPKAIRELGISLVPWNQKEISRAID